MRLVEVGGGKSTNPQAVTAALETYRYWGKRPVRLDKEAFGHIANRLASALWREAVHLAAEGVASVEDIDTAVVEGLGRKWAVTGPFLSYHLSGGDGGIAQFFSSYSAGIQRRWHDLGRPDLTENLIQRLTQMVLEEVGGRSREALETSRAHQIASLMTCLAENQTA
jgi:3-hydroxyacyl-CoA dehydrogenase